MQNQKKPIGKMIISFIIPLIGIIMYFVYRKDNESDAKACLGAAIFSLAIALVVNICNTALNLHLW